MLREDLHEGRGVLAIARLSSRFPQGPSVAHGFLNGINFNAGQVVCVRNGDGAQQHPLHRPRLSVHYSCALAIWGPNDDVFGPRHILFDSLPPRD